MRLIVAGGGTGGHLFPGLAVAEIARLQDPDGAILFVGSKYGIEANVLPRTNFPFEALAVRGLRGRGLRGIGQFLSQIPFALRRSRQIIRDFRPQIVLGLGGYSSVPLVVAAWWSGVPSILLEQNAHPGMANRFLARLAHKICTTFPESARFFPAGRAVLTGNPVRHLISPRQSTIGHFTLFVFGGSQGARSINRAAVDAARFLQGRVENLQILHQTGGVDVAWVEQQYRELKVTADVRAFVHDMGDAYAQADLLICRAGATTLAEITALGKPSILIPYPHAADDHQRANAQSLVSRGAAILVPDAELDGKRLAEEVLALANDRSRLAAMSRAASSLAVPDAAERVMRICSEIAEGVATV